MEVLLAAEHRGRLGRQGRQGVDRDLGLQRSAPPTGPGSHLGGDLGRSPADATTRGTIRSGGFPARERPFRARCPRTARNFSATLRGSRPDFLNNCLFSERQFGSLSALPHVLRSPEPHHPLLLVDGAKGGLRVVAVLDRSLRARVMPSRDRGRDCRRVVDCREIDRLEARRRAARMGRAINVGSARGRFAVDRGLAAEAHRDARRRRQRVRSRPAGSRAVAEGRRRVARRVRSRGGAAKTITGARVDGHDLKLRALEDLFLDLALHGRHARVAARVRAFP